MKKDIESSLRLELEAKIRKKLDKDEADVLEERLRRQLIRNITKRIRDEEAETKRMELWVLETERQAEMRKRNHNGMLLFSRLTPDESPPKLVFPLSDHFPPQPDLKEIDVVLNEVQTKVFDWDIISLKLNNLWTDLSRTSD